MVYKIARFINACKNIHCAENANWLERKKKKYWDFINLLQMHERKCFELGQIGNIDKVTITFDVLSNYAKSIFPEYALLKLVYVS